MWETIKRAMLTHKVNEVKQELSRVGESIQDLLMQPDIFSRLDARTAWSLIHGLEASFSVMEQTLRARLADNATLDSRVTRTLRDLQAATTTLRTTLGSLVPFVEQQYGSAPQDTQWKIEKVTS